MNPDQPNQPESERMMSVDDFISFFTSIPEKKWCTRVLHDHNGRSCAYGHCGWRDCQPETDNAMALRKLFRTNGFIVTQINDGGNSQFMQPTAKQRILAALQKIKDSQP